MPVLMNARSTTEAPPVLVALWLLGEADEPSAPPTPRPFSQVKASGPNLTQRLNPLELIDLISANSAQPAVFPQVSGLLADSTMSENRQTRCRNTASINEF
jgi:hypothetical protein